MVNVKEKNKIEEEEEDENKTENKGNTRVGNNLTKL